jgi:ferredoxin
MKNRAQELFHQGLSDAQRGAVAAAARGKVHIDPARCLSCGVCRTAFHRGAITLQPRRESQEEAEIW